MAVVDQVDDAGMAQLRHLAAYGFNGQPKEIGNVRPFQRNIKLNAIGPSIPG